MKFKFIISNSLVDDGEEIYLIGSSEELGGWNTENALILGKQQIGESTAF